LALVPLRPFALAALLRLVNVGIGLRPLCLSLLLLILSSLRFPLLLLLLLGFLGAGLILVAVRLALLRGAAVCISGKGLVFRIWTDTTKGNNRAYPTK
jgi:hypothetical protein